MAEGRILNRSLIQRVADLLNLEGVKRFPAHFDLDTVKATVDIGPFLNGGGGPVATALPNAGYGNYLAMEDSVDVGGDSEIEADIVGDGDGLIENNWPRTPGYAYQFDSIHCELEFDAAGATAFNGTELNLQLQLTDEGDPGFVVNLVHLDPWTIVQTGKLKYSWAFNGSTLRNAAGHFSNANGGIWNGGMVVDGPTNYRGNGLQQAMGSTKLRVFIDFAGNLPTGTQFVIKAIGRQSTNGIIPVRF